jgi:hypothetical protein
MTLMSKLESADGREDRSAFRQSGLDRPTEQNLGAATQNHRTATGVFGRAYQECPSYESRQRGGQLGAQVGLPVSREGIKGDCGHQTDRVLSGKSASLLLSFNLPILRTALKGQVKHDHAVAGLGVPCAGSGADAGDKDTGNSSGTPKTRRPSASAVK